MNQKLRELIDEAGGPEVVAKASGVSLRAVYKWFGSGGLPRTEYTGETQYATAIESVSNGRVTQQQLLEAGRRPKKKAA